ncbi:hypothetical protein A0J61_02016 [Choanephora cucurbitarum]|uniref:Uncharacterized protein n=1 Tax=Choanephora cucurbitarum TaxID=101091 RepID=A0A1C7NLA4_9FUNG|nr:hypothetical protein A0J61_02016 [Choanephora cucurbitarum]
MSNTNKLPNIRFEANESTSTLCLENESEARLSTTSAFVSRKPSQCKFDSHNTMSIKNTEIIIVDRLMRSGVSDADYILQKKEEATLGIKEEEAFASQNIDEEEEDAYRWVILFAAFLAQGTSSSFLGSW